jgi:hypothetical protein
VSTDDKKPPMNFSTEVIDSRPVYINGRKVTYGENGEILKVGDLTFKEYEETRKKFVVQKSTVMGRNDTYPAQLGAPSFFLENVKAFFEDNKYPTKESLAKAFGFENYTQWYFSLRRRYPDYTEAVNYIIERMPRGKNGAVPMYLDTEEFNLVVDEYFELVEKGRIPAASFTGLAYYLGYATKEWAQIFESGDENMKFCVKRALLRVEKAYEENLTVLKNPVGSIFALKNHGWSDGNAREFPLIENMLNVLTEAYRRRTENKGNVTNVRNKKQERLESGEISDGEVES